MSTPRDTFTAPPAKVVIVADNAEAPVPPLAFSALEPAPPPQRHHYRKFIGIGFVVLAVAAGAVWLHMSAEKKSQATSSAAAVQLQDKVKIGSLGDTYDSFYANGVADFMPAKKQSTLRAFSDLASGFSIGSAFYTDQPNLLVGLGIAQLYANNPAHKAGYRNELYLLTAPYLSAVPTGVSDANFHPNSSTTDQKTLATFAAFTDSSLTARLQTAIASSGVTKEVTDNLKLADGAKLTSTHILALNFDSSSPGQKDFAGQHYMYGAEPEMWVETVGTDTYILFAKDYAEGFVADPNGSDRNIVLHEFVHTQHPFVRGDLGHTVEERRAELFSGNKSAYYDAKQLFIYANVLGGIDLNSSLSTHAVDPDGFYLNLYAKFGVAGANALLASWPSVFLGSASAAVQSANGLSSNGGMDGVMQAAVALGAKDPGAMNARMKARSQTLFSVFQTKQAVLDDVSSNLGQNYAMPTAANAMTTYITQHY